MKFPLLKPRILIVTEKPRWILNRAASELVGLETTSFDFFFVWGVKRKLMRFFSKFFKFNLFDIVYFFPYYLFDSDIASLGKISICHMTHLEFDNDWKRTKWNSAIDYSDFFTALSVFSLSQITASGVDSSKIEIIPYGLSRNYVPSFHILLSGNLGKRKGKEFYVELRKLCDSHNLSISWRATKINDWGLDYFDFDHSNLVVPYSWADLLIVTSDLEGGHIGTLEAVSMSLPVLSRPVGWAMNELKDFVNLAETPLEMFNFIESLYKIWSNKYITYHFIESNFSYESFRKKHAILFENLLETQI